MDTRDDLEATYDWDDDEDDELAPKFKLWAEIEVWLPEEDEHVDLPIGPFCLGDSSGLNDIGHTVRDNTIWHNDNDIGFLNDAYVKKFIEMAREILAERRKKDLEEE